MFTYLLTTILIIILSLTVKLVAYKIENRMLFVPTVIPPEVSYPLAELNGRLSLEVSPDITLEEVWIAQAQDSVEVSSATKAPIHGIWYHHPDKKSVILYAHGNAGCVGTRLHFLEAFAPYCSVLMFDYRGYGKTTGHPCEQNLYGDILSAYHHLIDRRGFLPSDIVVYGESLGCSAVSWLGAHLADSDIKPKALVLQCGFSSLKHIAGDLFGRLLTPLLSSSLNNQAYVKKIGTKIPIVVAHSRNDELIHYGHSKRLVKANPAIIHVELPGSHSGPENFTSSYLGEIRKLFLD